jgi:serine/threonine protein kinase
VSTFGGEAQSDIFALGSTLCYLLTGQDPDPTSTAELPDRYASPQLARLLRDCHLVELDKRIASASILKIQLQVLAASDLKSPTSSS